MAFDLHRRTEPLNYDSTKEEDARDIVGTYNDVHQLFSLFMNDELPCSIRNAAAEKLLKKLDEDEQGESEDGDDKVDRAFVLLVGIIEHTDNPLIKSQAEDLLHGHNCP